MEDNPLGGVFSSDRSAQSSAPQSKKPAKKILMLVLVVVVLAGLVYAGLQFFGNSSGGDADVTPTPTEFFFPTDTPTPTIEEDLTPTPEEDEEEDTKPTPTKKPAVNPIDSTTGLDRSKLTLTVLNGAGTAGAAGTMADKLRSLGYNVSSTGNADNYNYDKTVIEVSSANSKYLDLLKKDLSSYSIGTTSASFSGGSGRVIVGKN